MSEQRVIGLIGMILFTAMFFVCLVILSNRVPDEIVALTGDAKTHVRALRSATGVGMVVALNAAALSWGLWKKK